MAKQLNILALDLATRTGWAHTCGTSGVQDFAPRRGDSPGMRWLEFRAWLNRVLDMAPAELIVFEQAHHRGGAATHVAHSLISVCEQVAAERGLEITSRHSASIKKHATGSGRGNKQDMQDAACKKWPAEGPLLDENEIDARWLLDLVQTQLLNGTGE